MGPRKVRRGRAMPKLANETLTEAGMRKLSLGEGGGRDRMVFDASTRGLGVRITAKSKTFVAQWVDRTTKQKRRVVIGTWGAITLDTARRETRRILGESVNGDPVAERKAKQAAAAEERRAAALTVEALLTEWEKRHLIHRREAYRRETVKHIRRMLPELLTRSAVTLTRADVMKALGAAREGKHLETRDGRSAGQAREVAVRNLVSVCRAMFNWGRKADLVTENPFANLPLAPAKAERDRWLDAAELGAVYAAAGVMPYPFGPFARLLVLTGQRLREVAGMRWSEVDLDRATWTMPAERQKNGKPHVVHLSAPALAVLREVAPLRRSVGDGSEKLTDFVFTTTGKAPVSGFSFAKADLDARSGVAAWAFHDLRRTLASGMADLGVSVEVAGKILAHKAGIMRGVDRVYQRSEFLAQRRDAIEAWGTHVAACATKAEAAGAVKAGAGRAAYRRARTTKIAGVGERTPREAA